MLIKEILQDGRYVKLVPVSKTAKPTYVVYSEGRPFSKVELVPIR